MIKAEVTEEHLSRFPQELEIVRKVESDFDVVWAKRYVQFNAQISAYFLKPLKHITEGFGFEAEVVMIYSGYEEMQARTIQALDRVMNQSPALGRVDQAVAIIVSDDPNVENWLRRYIAENPQSRVLVGINKDTLLAWKDSWDLRNKVANQLFSRDLFDYSLPIDNDIFFFGRASEIAEHVDAIRRIENRGLFGLRKSGKTSLLFKIQRECKRNGIAAIYIDCKLPSIYKLSGSEFLELLCEKINQAIRVPVKGLKGAKDGYSRFVRLMERMPANQNVCIILDEIEFVSFFSKLAPHWSQDFVPFWQTIWSSQSQFRKLSFIITGVNASVVEADLVDGVQNPMFGIVKSRYLVGFERIELEQLLRTLGRRMGLRFVSDATDFLHERYGGHPLLTRMICSHLHSQVRADARQRPFDVTSEFIRSGIEDREEEVVIYCNHIVSELRHSYPDEYDMLEMLAVDDQTGFNELAQDEDFIRHLKSYGLVDFSRQFYPSFKIPVLKKFVAREWRRRSGRPGKVYVVPTDARPTFVLARTTSILRDLRAINSRVTLVGTPELYEPAGPSEAEKFANAKVVRDEADLTHFLNQCQRSLIEPIDRRGRTLGQGSGYFFNVIKQHYTELWDALNRIRAYRNWICHIELNETAETEYQRYLRRDLAGTDPSAAPEGYFRIQSAILNGLAIALQATLASYE